MAAWIKIETTTPDKPEVIRIAAALRIDQDAVVGKLIRLWSWADANTVDGSDVGVTLAFIDRLTCQKGFAKAMLAVGWLTGQDGALHFPGFDRHNGSTAKARAETNRRVTDHRERNKLAVTNVTGKTLQNPLPDKRREENLESESERAREQEGDALMPPAEAIAAEWGLAGNPTRVVPLIQRSLEQGEAGLAKIMLANTRRCAELVRTRAPGGFAARFVPSAERFFDAEDWRSPERFENRWQHEWKRGDSTAQKATKAALLDRGGASLPGADHFGAPETITPIAP